MRKYFLAAVFAGASSGLLAQQQPDQVRIVTSEAMGGRPMTVDFIGSSGGSLTNRTVKGLPYAAESVTETSQTLQDGNRIARKVTTAVYRDSLGRMRNEIAMPAVGPWASGKGEKMVNIYDPVSKTSIMLHPDKTAMKHTLPSMEGAQWTENANGQTRTMVFNRHIQTARTVQTDSANGETAKTHVIEDVVIERGPVPAEGGTMVRMRTSASGGASKHTFRKESLGKKLIEGVEAEGTKAVSTIPAGEIGNERDIEIVDETWYSKEIEALVYSRHSDPQTGETIYRLTNIQRGEQPIGLFEVPADYKVTNGPGRIVEMKLRSPKPGNEE